MLVPEKILKELRITEKSNILSSTLNQYTFEVAPGSNRAQVAQAVEKIFGVKVERVNLLNRRGKAKANRRQGGKIGHKPGMRKAMVTLGSGDKIELV